MSVQNIFLLFLGGFLITAGANTINQILEKDYDKLMKRTRNRPLAAGRMHAPEAILTAGVTGIAGILILWLNFNSLSALLGAVSLLSYAFIYTPLKRISPFAVLAGAFPGALPPLIGWICATGTFSYEAFIIPGIQFLWQFPHFWAIAWVAHDDYKNAGFKLLPSSGGKDKKTAALSAFYILILMIVTMTPFFAGMINILQGTIIFLAGLIFLYQALKLYITCETRDAKYLMFASIAYLPVVLISFLAGVFF